MEGDCVEGEPDDEEDGVDHNGDGLGLAVLHVRWQAEVLLHVH